MTFITTELDCDNFVHGMFVRQKRVLRIIRALSYGFFALEVTPVLALGPRSTIPMVSFIEMAIATVSDSVLSDYLKSSSEFA